MKKTVLILSLLLSMLLCFGTSYAEETPEETKPFDLSVYESADNYSYDRFDKMWNVYGAYHNEYSDAVVVLGLRVEGNKKSVTAPPYFYMWIREENNIHMLHSITGLQLIANDILFSAMNVEVDEANEGSMMLLDSVNGKELLSAIVAGSEMDIKMIYDTGSHIETISGDGYADIQKIAKLILDNDSWAYVPDIADWDEYINEEYPIVIDTDD